MSFLAGSHQVAQYWISTTLPRNLAKSTTPPVRPLPETAIALPTESSRTWAPEAFCAAGDSAKSLTIRAYHFFASSSWPVNSWAMANWSMASAASVAFG